MRVNVVLPEDTIKKIDSIARDENKSRSGLLREAAEKVIAERERATEERMRRERIARAIEIQDRLRRKAGRWDGVAEVRKWRELNK